jgi:glycerol-3-phosphate acyltransferase PlsY
VIYPIAFLLLTYVLAAVPFAVVLTTLRGAPEDIRDAGSKNPGATNVARLHGWKLGAAVLALDVGKGAVPAVAARWLWPEWDPWFGGVVVVVAFAAHVFPIYLEFRGGKGVSTAAGGLLALAPLVTLLAAAVWSLLLAVSGRSSVATLGAVLAIVGFSYLLAPQILVVVVGLGLAIFVTHTPNLRRIWRGEESSVVRPVRWKEHGRSDGEEALSQGPAGTGTTGAAPWPTGDQGR